MSHPDQQRAKVCYYYMPARDQRPAEIILVLNSNSWCIQVPVREEDIELYAFFYREMTTAEVKQYGNKQSWNIYTSWDEMIAEHLRHDVDADMLAKIREFKPRFTLKNEVVAFEKIEASKITA